MAERENLLTLLEDFIVWFLPKIEKFPRNYKFLIGDRIVRALLDVNEHLVAAYYSRSKIESLRRANIGLEKIRRLLSLCVRMKWLTPKQLQYATRQIERIGKLLGGWIKQQQSKEANRPNVT